MLQQTDNQATITGSGTLRRLRSVLSQLEASRVFLVLDEGALATESVKVELNEALRGMDVHSFTGFAPNPRMDDVESGIRDYHAFRPDVVVGLGGGTAIDIAKLITTFAVQPRGMREILNDSIGFSVHPKPLIAIPTTSGTGSEATHFAVVYIDGKKHSVADDILLPCFVILDPTLTHSMPRGLTAATGLDAFCQAMESLWSVNATDESVRYAEQALRLTVEHLQTAVHSPTDEAREGMSRAAHLAGKAINISKTTLPHALSYAMTSRFQVPHGMAVAMTLAECFRFNSQLTDRDCLDDRGPEHVRDRLALIHEVFSTSDYEETAVAIEELVRGTGCSPTLREAGHAALDRIAWLVDQVNQERLANNPRRANRESLIDMLSCRSATLARPHVES